MATMERVPTAALRPAEPPAGVEHGQASTDRWGLVVVAGLSIYMAQLDTTIVNVALPAIEADLGLATSITQWIVLAYLVPLIGLSLLAGRWLDTIGHRPALSIAVVGFAAASIAAGVAPNAVLLIAARATQGSSARCCCRWPRSSPSAPSGQRPRRGRWAS